MGAFFKITARRTLRAKTFISTEARMNRRPKEYGWLLWYEGLDVALVVVSRITSHEQGKPREESCHVKVILPF